MAVEEEDDGALAHGSVDELLGHTDGVVDAEAAEVAGVVGGADGALGGRSGRGGARPAGRACAGGVDALGGADLAGVDGELEGPGGDAELVALDIEDLGLFQKDGAHMSVIMKDGAFVKNGLQ